MVSSTFQQLYVNAMQQEHVIIREVEELWQAKVVSTFPRGVRMVQLLQQANSDFLDGIEQVVFRHQMRLRGSLRGGCPHCDDPNCTGDIDFIPEFLEQFFSALPWKPPPAAP